MIIGILDRPDDYWYQRKPVYTFEKSAEEPQNWINVNLYYI